MRFLSCFVSSISKRIAEIASIGQKRSRERNKSADLSTYNLFEDQKLEKPTNNTSPLSLVFIRTYKRLQMGNISGGGHGKRTSKSMDDSEFSSPRIRLSDGRYLAYRETGVPKEEANFKIIIVHGFGSSKEMSFSAPEGLIEDLKIYMLLYDRAGYAESDPHLERSLKSEASDIEQLADQLELGPKFYVIGVSLGSYPTWSCLKYIPHRQVFQFRLQGVALVAAVVNYRWPSLPHSLIKDDYRRGLVRLSLFVLKYMPSLLYWWMTQKCIPTANVMEKNPVFFCERDMEVLKRTPGFELLSENKIEQRSVFDNLRSDMMVGFSKWEFDPLKLNNPFPNDEGSVHLWVGYDDKVVPVELQRHVMEELPWIKYHEIPHGGHLIVYDSEVCESILRGLLLSEEPVKYMPLPGTPKLQIVSS
ncbi:Tiny macrocysts protein B [Bienertia sinuspersici]